MELPNIHFEDFPIDFKQINPEDFPNFHTTEKIIISPDSNGYIKTPLTSHIKLHDKNTVVINAGVGQGKTTAIIDVVKQYYTNTDYVVFLASPFVSLVEQYYKDILEKEIPERDVFRYEVLGNEEPADFWHKRVHIVTANCLLGNPGEDAFINSSIKRYYINRLVKYCEKHGKKVIFIYDEIHDAIHNFKEKYIFNLWKWRNVILKNYIISATYNEASKVVIEYLAELTDDKIQIIESERIRFPEKQSELFLHYNNEQFYTYDDKTITELVKELIYLGKNIDILSYSKTLADNIIKNKDSGIGKELYSKYDKINNCTSELVLNQRNDRAIPQNRYNSSLCNVGTNFKTGVSIKKENHAYVIILPPRGAKMLFKNNYGIFSGGINSIIQALARQRVKGEIHLILPKPKDFDFESLHFEEVEKTEEFKEFYTSVMDIQEVEYKVKYLTLSSQNELLSTFYEKEIKENIKQEIDFVKTLDRSSKARLDFPEYRLFKLDEGEAVLAKKYDFFGNDLSSYITYCAITNQFINCKLVSGNRMPTIIFKYGEIQKGLKEYCNNYYFKDDRRMHIYYFYNDAQFYNIFRDDLFNNFQLIFQTSSGQKLPLKKNGTASHNKYFELQLLSFVQHFGYPNNPVNKYKYFKDGELHDGLYDRSQYFLEGLAHAERINIDDVQDNPLATRRLKAFKFLSFLRQQIISSQQTITTAQQGTFQFVLNKPDADFIPQDRIEEFREMLKHFLEEDEMLSKYDFKDRFVKKEESKQIESLYSIIIADFHKTENYKESTGARRNGKKILIVRPIPNHTEVVNYISLPDYDYETLPETFFEVNALSEEEIRNITEQVRRN